MRFRWFEIEQVRVNSDYKKTLAKRTTAELDRKRKDQEQTDMKLAVSTRKTVENLNRWYEKQNAHAPLKREGELLSSWPWCFALQECREKLKGPEQEMASAVSRVRESLENLESLCPGESRARVKWWLVENGAEEKTVGTLLRNFDYVPFLRELFSDTEVDVEGVDTTEEVEGNGEDDEEDADSTEDADEDGKPNLVEVDGVMGSWDSVKSVDGGWGRMGLQGW